VYLQCQVILLGSSTSDGSAGNMLEAVLAGEVLRPRCSLAYAPPEVVLAVEAGRHVTVAPEHDMWALGVIVFECVTRTRVCISVEKIQSCAHGWSTYPWEEPSVAQPPAWRASRLRSMVFPFLARDATLRPSAAALLSAVRSAGIAPMSLT
jgi:serine/threonine protein kinase